MFQIAIKLTCVVYTVCATRQQTVSQLVQWTNARPVPHIRDSVRLQWRDKYLDQLGKADRNL